MCPVSIIESLQSFCCSFLLFLFSTFLLDFGATHSCELIADSSNFCVVLRLKSRWLSGGKRLQVKTAVSNLLMELLLPRQISDFVNCYT